jgi:hypothetical protein
MKNWKSARRRRKRLFYDRSGLYFEAAKRGLRLEPRGDKLAVIPANRLPPDFADVLRQHKRELLDWLNTMDARSTPDHIPWLHIARQVLASEFDGCDHSTRESLIIGLRSIRHCISAAALRRLAEKPI